MPENTTQYIANILLSDGVTYKIKDTEALRTSGGRITGDLTIDNKLTTGQLYIMSIQYMLDDSPSPTNVLVIDEQEGEDKNKVKKRDINKLLKDIGGISCQGVSSDGELYLKEGK